MASSFQRMTLMPSPLIQVDAEQRRPHSAREHRRTSSEFGWFDIEALLSSRTSSTQSEFWGSDSGDDVMQGSTASDPGPDSVLPRALERVFRWLQEVEAPDNTNQGASGVDEAIIDAGALLHLQAPSSSVMQENDKVMNSSAVTKADFCVASRDQPSLAVGIYAYRVVCRSKWMLWSDSYPEFLVVTATGTELLRAWRTFSDFSALAQSARALGAAVAAEFWNRLDQVLGSHQGRRTDPSSLKTQSRLLGRFLTIMLEELAHSDVDVLAEFAREPMTYVIVGVEDLEAETHEQAPGAISQASSAKDTTSTIRNSYVNGNASWPPGGAAFGAESVHLMKCGRLGSPLKPEPRVWEGL